MFLGAVLFLQMSICFSSSWSFQFCHLTLVASLATEIPRIYVVRKILVNIHMNASQGPTKIDLLYPGERQGILQEPATDVGL